MVAKIYVCGSTQMGFPAFDARRGLIGFYREYGDDADLRLNLVPLSVATAIGAGLSEANAAKATSALDCEVRQGSKSVFDLAGSGGDLEALKKAVQAYFWSKEGEAAGDDGFFDIDSFEV